MALESRPSGGSFNKVATSVFDFSVPFFLEIKENNALGVKVNAEPSVNVQSVSLLGLKDWNEEFIENIALAVLPDLIPDITAAIGAIEIPSIVGYTVAVSDIWVDPSDQAYVFAAGELIEAE